MTGAGKTEYIIVEMTLENNWRTAMPSYNSSAVSFRCMKTKQKHCKHIIICQRVFYHVSVLTFDNTGETDTIAGVTLTLHRQVF